MVFLLTIATAMDDDPLIFRRFFHTDNNTDLYFTNPQRGKSTDSAGPGYALQAHSPNYKIISLYTMHAKTKAHYQTVKRTALPFKNFIDTKCFIQHTILCLNLNFSTFVVFNFHFTFSFKSFRTETTFSYGR